jgi:hypothetical protein
MSDYNQELMTGVPRKLPWYKKRYGIWVWREKLKNEAFRN